MTEPHLRITEIFYSLQGETTTSGLPTVFVRLTGCPLRCHYCDTQYAFYGGERKALTDVLEEVGAFNPRYVTVTGGEPLAQPECLPLLKALCDAGYRVSLETSGALPVAEVDLRVHIILDLKTPGSGEVARNLWSNIACLSAKDEIKFVICNRTDYEWARLKIDEYKLAATGAELLFSPSQGQLEARALADWVLADRLSVRLQLQLHKYLWGDGPGH
ncbi:MAG: 7-carboxy-7-deazaguanine synthase QueE [Gammaproteobacteria bacterium]|nr:7-carboxy-7-deazaguanine synthase QueE [Gammaproteobacteria bacterium]